MESALHAAERALELCGQRGEDLEREAETNRTSMSMFSVVLNEFHISKGENIRNINNLLKLNTSIRFGIRDV